MAGTLTSIRLDTQLADEAAKVLGVKTRTEAVHVALREVVALRRFKNLMKKNAGKLVFSGSDE
jgi:Arc/MetJ family transcription regulator